MIRGVFQRIADPTRWVILSFVAFKAMTHNALGGYLDCSRRAVLKHIKMLTECEWVKQVHPGRKFIVI
jgi:hypothetical protein